VCFVKLCLPSGDFLFSFSFICVLAFWQAIHFTF
jgi:hypothetical protein